jgi:hypothetical protein
MLLDRALAAVLVAIALSTGAASASEPVPTQEAKPATDVPAKAKPQRGGISCTSGFACPIISVPIRDVPPTSSRPSSTRP